MCWSEAQISASLLHPVSCEPPSKKLQAFTFSYLKLKFLMYFSLKSNRKLGLHWLRKSLLFCLFQPLCRHHPVHFGLPLSDRMQQWKERRGGGTRKRDVATSCRQSNLECKALTKGLLRGMIKCNLCVPFLAVCHQKKWQKRRKNKKTFSKNMPAAANQIWNVRACVIKWNPCIHFIDVPLS